jgi:hypothetical protein
MSASTAWASWGETSATCGSSGRARTRGSPEAGWLVVGEAQAQLERFSHADVTQLGGDRERLSCVSAVEGSAEAGVRVVLRGRMCWRRALRRNSILRASQL